MVRASCLLLAAAMTASTAAPLPPPPPAQCAAVRARAPCGQPTDSAALCATKGCCYDAAGGPNSCFYPGGDAVPITTVLIVQACHFDAGYADTMSNILNNWFHKFFPRALALGEELDARGGRERLRFTAQSWIVSLFIDCPPGLPGLVCPTASELANFTRAVEAGYITWHAFPFNGEPELMSLPTFEAAVALTHALDDRFGLPRKATLSQRDVPGLTRAVVPALAAAGVRALSVGVNPWSTPPVVPRAFVWLDEPSGVSLPAMWHPGYYGGITYDDAVVLPGLATAVVFDWRGDNAGPPQSVAEVVSDFKAVAAAFPNATALRAATFDDFTALLTPEVVAGLPVITSEIGDTWLHGCVADPLKSAMYKRAAAVRAACLASGACAPGDPAVANFTRLLLKNAEHTFGESIGHFRDNVNWTNAQFEAARAASPAYAAEITSSWVEQRTYGLYAALDALTRPGHPLGATVAAAWADLRPSGAPSLAGWTPMAAGGAVHVGLWTLAIDAASGALTTLSCGGAVWANASADGSSFLARPEYRTYSAADVQAWEAAYNTKGPNAEFGRDPSFAAARTVTQAATPRMRGLWSRPSAAGGVSLLLQADFADAPELHADYGAPAALWTQLDVPADGGAINVSLTMLGKTPTRLLDGLFYRFNASSPAGGRLAWRVEKIGSNVDPFDVQPGGNVRHHGVDGAVTATATGGAELAIGAPDAPLAAFGEPSVFPVAPGPVDPSEGVAFLLSANLWNTNYPFWYPFVPGDGDLRWRFSLSSSP